MPPYMIIGIKKDDYLGSPNFSLYKNLSLFEGFM